jgi:aryl-alcohol dehydrogenase-like predicted oxidoreductase
MNENRSETPLRLGQTDLFISPLGIGTWSWGDRMIWGYGQKNGYTDEDIHAAFQSSLESGINFYDTAEVYGFGLSEEILGRLVREATRPGKKIVVASKFMPYPFRISRRFLMRSLRNSLKHLGMENLDLYQIHWPLPPISIETWMDELAGAIQAGLIRAAGVSNYSLEQMLRASRAMAKRGASLASNQVKYSLLTRNVERSGLLAACKEFGITLIAYSPLEMGMLTGKYTPENRPSGLRGWRYSRHYLYCIQPLIDVLRRIGEAHGGKTPAQVALNWVMCKGALPIVGAKNLRQAQENAGALGWRLTEAEVAALDEISDATTKP